MYPILFEAGHFQLRSYGVIFLLSFLAALWLARREAARKGIDPALVGEFSVYALLGGILGARLYYIAFSDPLHYLKNPWEILAVWHGGIGVIGSLIGGFLVAVWFSRKKQLPLLRLADVLAPGVALGQTLGQFACLSNGDSYGKETDLPWAITYTDPRALAPQNVPLHPIEIYEMAAYLLVFLLVWGTRKRFKADGATLLVYLGAYGVARFTVEFWRGHPALVGGIPAAQIAGAAFVLIAVLGFARLRAGSRRNA